MRISLLGGTGDIGAGLALRLGLDTDHAVVVGSREESRALERAAEYERRVRRAGGSPNIHGTDNATAAGDADVVVLAVPPEYAIETATDVSDALAAGTVLVSPAVAMSREEQSFTYDRPQCGSIAERIAGVVPEDVSVVGAFQNLPAGTLADLDADLSLDVVVTADDTEAKTTVMDLTDEIGGLRALDGGRLRDTAKVESVTPLLVTLACNNEDLHDLGVRFG